MKVAFLRSIEVQQTAPFLRAIGGELDRRGITARLFYTDGRCGPDDFPGSAEKLPSDISVEELFRAVLEWGADGVISLSIADDNALRDAFVCERLRAVGVPAVMHSPHATSILANKWDTKLLARSFGIETPDGILVDGDLLNNRSVSVPAYQDLLFRKASEISYPILSKPIWDCLGNGIKYLSGGADLERYLKDPYNGNTIFERCHEGELCSVEIVGARGYYEMQPLIWKGMTGKEPSFAFTAVRHSLPWPQAEEEFSSVAPRLIRLCEELDICGSVEAEMIYADGRFLLIEMNPRVSGSTSLSIVSSGVNTYLALVLVLTGDWPSSQETAGGEQRRVALQFPVRPLSRESEEATRAALNVIRLSDFTVNDVRYGNALIECGASEVARTYYVLRDLSDTYGLLTDETLRFLSAGFVASRTNSGSKPVLAGRMAR